MLSRNVCPKQSPNDLLSLEHLVCDKDTIRSWIGEELKNIRENEEKSKQEEMTRKIQQKKIELQEHIKMDNMYVSSGA